MVAALCFVLAGSGAAARRAVPQELPDVRQAERDLERARAEFEEIVGPRLLHLDPPPLPEVPRPELAPDEKELVDRLFDAPPGEWSGGERARLAEVLARELPRLSAVSSRGEVVTTEGLLARAVRLLIATRLSALRDRLRLLEGREPELSDGLDLRADLATRLSLQPSLVGPLLGNAVFLRVLEDVHAAVERPATSRATLERLDALLFRWRLEAPDAAAVLARDMLTTLDRGEAAQERRELGAEDPARAVFSAPWVQDVADLARRCRKAGCRVAVAAIETRKPGEESPYRVIADLAMPNVLDGVKRITGVGELARIAHTAVALRLEALELGAYPDNVDRVVTQLGFSPSEAAELSYEHRPGGGAQLRLTSEHVVTDAIERRRETLRRLLAWNLPTATLVVHPASSPTAVPGTP